MPENKLKRQLDFTIALATAANHFNRGEYAEAAHITNACKPKSFSERITHALIRAELCLAHGDTEAAKRLFTEIAQKGNKLFAVTLAKKHLESLA